MKNKLLVMVLIVLTITACNVSSSGSSSTNKLAEAKRCIKIDLYKCDDFTPRATITNECSEDIWMAKILITGYSSEGGSKVDADEEYVEDLTVGEDKDIEAVFDPDFKGKINYCEAEVEEVVFK